LRFLDGAVVALGDVDAGARLQASGRELAPDRMLEGGSALWNTRWSPGVAHALNGGAAEVAPELPEAWTVTRIDLPDAGGDGALPDTALAFSPSGEALAVGAFDGTVLVVDAWNGRERWRSRVPEGFAKRLAFSPDGRRLYVGAQSPRGSLRCLAAGDGSQLWERELAEHVQPSSRPRGRDRYGVYELPAAQRLLVLESGELLVAASHAWTLGDGQRRNRSRVLRYSPEGDLMRAWPPEGPMALSLVALSASEDGERIAFATSLSADPDPGESHVGGGIYLLDEGGARLRFGGALEPVPPYRRALLWNALALSPDGRRLLAGWADGRARIYDTEAPGPGLPPPLAAHDRGLPIYIGPVPVASGVGFGLATDEHLVWQTTLSVVPWNARVAAETPPSPHPHANTLWVHDSDGELLGSYRGPWVFGGLAATGDRLYALAGERPDDRHDLFAVLAFALKPQLEPRLLWVKRFEAPPFFEMAVAPSGGLVAVVETPLRRANGQRVGHYRVHVLR
jgi:sugar lactone lactonase YvrE